MQFMRGMYSLVLRTFREHGAGVDEECAAEAVLHAITVALQGEPRHVEALRATAAVDELQELPVRVARHGEPHVQAVQPQAAIYVHHLRVGEQQALPLLYRPQGRVAARQVGRWGVHPRAVALHAYIRAGVHAWIAQEATVTCCLDNGAAMVYERLWKLLWRRDCSLFFLTPYPPSAVAKNNCSRDCCGVVTNSLECAPNLYWPLPDIELLLFVLSFEFILTCPFTLGLCRTDTMMPLGLVLSLIHI